MKFGYLYCLICESWVFWKIVWFLLSEIFQQAKEKKALQGILGRSCSCEVQLVPKHFSRDWFENKKVNCSYRDKIQESIPFLVGLMRLSLHKGGYFGALCRSSIAIWSVLSLGVCNFKIPVKFGPIWFSSVEEKDLITITKYLILLQA